MRRVAGLTITVALLGLASCARPAVEVAPTSQAAPTAGPTSVLSIGGQAPGGVPTAAPTTAPTAAPIETVTVQRGTIEDVLVLGGQISAVQQGVSFVQDGIIQQIYVQPGQTVQAGELLAALDQGDLATQLRQARLAVQQDESSLSRAQEAGRLELQVAELDIEAAKKALEQARQGATPVEIAQARADLRQAQAALDTVRNNSSQAKNQAKQTLDEAVRNLEAIQQDYGIAVNQLARAKGEEASLLRDQVLGLEQQLIEAESVMKRALIDYDTARNNEVAAVSNAEAAIAVAQANLEVMLRGPDPFVIAERERAVRRAELAVAQVRQRNAPDPSLVRAIEVGRLTIEEIEAQVNQRRLYAPFAGEVALVNQSAGLPTQAGTPVVTLLDRSRLEVVADGLSATSRTVPPQLSPGQKADVTFARYPGQVFSATVTQAPSSAAADSGSVTYHLAFDAKGNELGIGDEATVSIVLGRKVDTLWLPSDAVRVTRDRTFVVVRDGEDERRVDVVTGIITEERVEILSGLRENDVVIIQ